MNAHTQTQKLRHSHAKLLLGGYVGSRVPTVEGVGSDVVSERATTSFVSISICERGILYLYSMLQSKNKCSWTPGSWLSDNQKKILLSNISCVIDVLHGRPSHHRHPSCYTASTRPSLVVLQRNGPIGASPTLSGHQIVYNSFTCDFSKVWWRGAHLAPPQRSRPLFLGLCSWFGLRPQFSGATPSTFDWGTLFDLPK